MTDRQSFAAEQWDRVRRDFARSFLIDTPIAQLAKDVATSWPFSEASETPRKYIGMSWDELCKCPGLSSHRARCFKLLRILDETLAFDTSFSLLAEEQAEEPAAEAPAAEATPPTPPVETPAPASAHETEASSTTAVAELPEPEAETEADPLLFYHDPALFDPISSPQAFNQPPPVSRRQPSSHQRVQFFEAALRQSRVLEIARVELESHLVYPRFRETGHESSHSAVY